MLIDRKLFWYRIVQFSLNLNFGSVFNIRDRNKAIRQQKVTCSRIRLREHQPALRKRETQVNMKKKSEAMGTCCDKHKTNKIHNETKHIELGRADALKKCAHAFTDFSF